MPSGKKYERHQSAVTFLSESKSYDFIGSYKEYSAIYGKDSHYKNSDLVSIHKGKTQSWEIKCHKDDSDWGEISWDQAERLQNNEDMIIVEYSSDGEKVLHIDGSEFVSKWCYFTKNGRIHYNYKKRNKRVSSHPVTKQKLKQAQAFFE